MLRHTECDNVVLLAVGLEFLGVVAIVAVKDAVFDLGVIHKGKLLANNLWIFAFGPLVVLFTRKTRPEFWLALDEVVSPSNANRGRVAFA